METSCPFCEIDPGEILFANDLALVLVDRYPVAEGHMLVIPRRHFESYFDATPDEIAALHLLTIQCRDYLDKRFQPDGYNIGINIGKPAGQSIFHLHIHLIPRYRGDHPRPWGGVRNILPRKGDYRVD